MGERKKERKKRRKEEGCLELAAAAKGFERRQAATILGVKV
ncbi:hypothetical protein V6Z12_D08G111300 [Gossypium hirsutum]